MVRLLSERRVRPRGHSHTAWLPLGLHTLASPHASKAPPALPCPDLWHSVKFEAGRVEGADAAVTHQQVASLHQEASGFKRSKGSYLRHE